MSEPQKKADPDALRLQVADAALAAAKKALDESGATEHTVLEGLWLAMQMLVGPREAAEVIRYSLLIDCDK